MTKLSIAALLVLAIVAATHAPPVQAHHVPGVCQGDDEEDWWWEECEGVHPRDSGVVCFWSDRSSGHFDHEGRPVTTYYRYEEGPCVKEFVPSLGEITRLIDVPEPVDPCVQADVDCDVDEPDPEIILSLVDDVLRKLSNSLASLDPETYAY